MWKVTFNILVCLQIYGTLCRAADVCLVDSDVKYCDYGCCSNACCGLSTIAIVGLVIGSLLSLAALVGCIVCLACMCKQGAGSRGHTVMPYNANSIVVHNSGLGHPAPSYNSDSVRGGGAPGRSNYGNYNDPVYPPGMVNEAHPPPSYSYNDPGRKY